MTTKHPYFEFEKNTFEIDEFDCASIFLLVGEEKALVIDTGIGIGDLKGVIHRLTDKPLTVVLSHGHSDHIGNCGAFEEVYMHPADQEIFPYPESVEARRGYATTIAHREHKSYPYTEEDFPVYEKMPLLRPLQDGQVFDLGGRRVTAWHCPGHTPGEMVFIDDQTRILFCGDACNNNLGLFSPVDSPAFVSVERAAQALHRIYDMRENYDKVYNGHHDYRGFGAPLADDVLPNAVRCYDEILEGHPNLVEVPDMFDPASGKTRTVAMRGKTMVFYHQNGIWDKKIDN